MTDAEIRKMLQVLSDGEKAELEALIDELLQQQEKKTA